MADLISGRTFLITGAAQGIGRALAMHLYRRGAHLALADIAVAQLDTIKSELSSSGQRVSLHEIDLTETDAAKSLCTAVIGAHGGVDGLINNAGATILGPFSAISAQDFEWLIALNFTAPVRLTRRLLPHLLVGRDPVIVNLSSVFGLIAPAAQSAYAASKFALRGFSEALMHELADGPVRVVTVHPGGVKTGIVRHARLGADLPASAQEAIDRRFSKAAKTTPEQAAAAIVGAIDGRVSRLLIGPDARFIDVLQRLMPVRHWNILGPLLRPR